MLVEDLNDKTIEPFMMRMYDNPQCTTIQEFQEDIKRLKYINRVCNRHLTGGELRERLILNHIIILYNVFGVSTTRILFYKMEESCYSVLKTFLVYLGHMPEVVDGINGTALISVNIPLDVKIISLLRGI